MSTPKTKAGLPKAVRTPPGRKPKKISYHPGKEIKRLERAVSARSEMIPEVIKEEDLKRRATKMHIRGYAIDKIAAKLHIDPDVAFKYIREKVKHWIEHESFDPVELREVFSKRYDNAFAMALYEACPHPMTDEFGRPVMGNICDCHLPPGMLCWEEGHTAQKMTAANKEWLKAALDVMKEQKSLFGLDAADKLKAKQTELLERVYKGVDPKVIEQL